MSETRGPVATDEASGFGWANATSGNSTSPLWGSSSSSAELPGHNTLALIRYLAQQLFRRDFEATRINHGLNEVRFPAPAPVGSSLRAKAGILDLRDGPAGVGVTTRYLLEIDDGPQTACAAEMLVLLSRRSTDATQRQLPPARELQAVLQGSGATAIVCEDGHRDTLDAVRDQTELKHFQLIEAVPG